MTCVVSSVESTKLLVPFLEERINVNSHRARTDQCTYVLAVVSRTVISAIKHLLSTRWISGGMTLDLENENTHSR